MVYLKALKETLTTNSENSREQEKMNNTKIYKHMFSRLYVSQIGKISFLMPMANIVKLKTD